MYFLHRLFNGSATKKLQANLLPKSRESDIGLQRISLWNR